MKALKHIGYSAVAATTLAYSSTFAAITTESANGKVDEKLKGTGGTLESNVQSIIAFITNLLYLIAVAFVLYGGFLMLTAGGEEDKVKKGKTILMQAALGLLVIFLASTFVSFILRAITAV